MASYCDIEADVMRSLGADPATAARHRPWPGRADWWVEARLGVSYHWGAYSLPARGEWVRSAEQMSIADYQRYVDAFTADRYDPNAWLNAAAEMGAGYAVLTTKHHDGFCLFDTKLTDYNVMNTPAGRDVVGEYVDACRAAGVRVGLYYSLVDWHHGDYPAFGDRQHPSRHDAAFKDRHHDWPRYVEFLHGQVRELLTNYGHIDLLVFDFSYYDFVGEAWGATALMRMIRELQAEVVVNDRLSNAVTGNMKSAQPPAWSGDFDTCELNTPHGLMLDAHGRAVPWDLWITETNAWSWSTADEAGTHHKRAEDVVRTLVNVASKSGNLTLNFAPDTRGELAGHSLELQREVGQWMQRHGESVRGCVAAPLERPDWGRWTLSADGRTLYAHITERPMGHLTLRGLRGKVRNPRLLATGAEGVLGDFWNLGVQAFGEHGDVFLNIQRPLQATHAMPDDRDTVIALAVVPVSEQAEEVRRVTVDPLTRVVF